MAELTLKLKLKDKTVEVTMDTLVEALGLDETPESVRLCVGNGHETMEACASPLEQDYPGIDVDAFDENDEQIYLMSAELPNGDLPGTIGARLYAGYARAETDEPIARVTTRIRADEELLAREDTTIEAREPKNVHGDAKYAAARDWTSMDGLQEYGNR